MMTWTPDATRQLVTDRHEQLAALARPRRVPPRARMQAPGERRRSAFTRLLTRRTPPVGCSCLGCSC